MARKPTVEKGEPGPAPPAADPVRRLEAGVYPGIPADVYHADPAPEPSLSSSIAAILLQRSPAHAWHAHPRLNPDFELTNDPKFDLGKAAHAVLIENREPVGVEFEDWRTKLARERRAEILAAGGLPLLLPQFHQVQEMVAAARLQLAMTEEAADIFDGEAEGETTIVWCENCWCRMRPDWLQRSSRYLIDYKTCNDASFPAIAGHLYAIGADLQSEFYRRGARATFGEDFEYRFVCQEIRPPYALSIIGLSPQAQELAQGEVAQALEIWTRCLAENRWPAYPARTSWIDAPGWIAKQMENAAIQRDLDAAAGVDAFELAIQLYRR